MLNNYLNITKEIVLKHMATQPYKVFLFGSRACGNAKKFSYIDIGIFGNAKLSSMLRFKIEEEIDESIVPFKVDIVDFFSVDEKFKTEALKQIVQWN